MKSISPFCLFVILFGLSGVFLPREARGDIRVFGRPYTFSLSPQAGVLHGTVYEIVYKNRSSSAYLSELQWELKPLWYLGFNAALEPRQGWGLFAELDFKAGLPLKTGSTEDRDWDYCTVPGALTHFSSHENSAQLAFLVNLDSGVTFPFRQFFFLRGFLSLNYRYFSMEARDGYLQYGPNGVQRDIYEPWDPSLAKDSASGPGMRYFQHWLLLSPGAGFGAALGRFTLFASLKISPLIFCIAQDDHLWRNLLFTDYMALGLYVEPALDISFAFNSRLRAGIKAAYSYTAGTRGDNYLQPYGSNTADSAGVSKNTAGGGLQTFDGSIYLSFRF